MGSGGAGSNNWAAENGFDLPSTGACDLIHVVEGSEELQNWSLLGQRTGDGAWIPS